MVFFLFSDFNVHWLAEVRIWYLFWICGNNGIEGLKRIFFHRCFPWYNLMYEMFIASFSSSVFDWIVLSSFFPHYCLFLHTFDSFWPLMNSTMIFLSNTLLLCASTFSLHCVSSFSLFILGCIIFPLQLQRYILQLILHKVKTKCFLKHFLAFTTLLSLTFVAKLLIFSILHISKFVFCYLFAKNWGTHSSHTQILFNILI